MLIIQLEAVFCCPYEPFLLQNQVSMSLEHMVHYLVSRNWQRTVIIKMKAPWQRKGIISESGRLMALVLLGQLKGEAVGPCPRFSLRGKRAECCK